MREIGGHVGQLIRLAVVLFTLCAVQCNDQQQQPIVNLDDYQVGAEKILSRGVYDWIAEGNWNEVTRVRNRVAFDAIQLWPRYLRDVSQIDTTKEVLGAPLDYPIGISPTSFHRAYHPDGEIATARACEELGNVYIMSYFSSTRMQDITRVAPHRCRKWVQIYFKPNRTNNVRVIKEAEALGWEAVVITIDSANYGAPYRERRNNFAIQNEAETANIPISETFEPFVDPTFTWDDVDWVRSLTKLPIIIRCVHNPLDAAEAIRHGAAGIYVSNHGGRQLDTVPSTIEVLPDIIQVVRASKRKVDVYLDGGIRTGVDAFKAFAYGANMIFLGRPTLFSLAVNGTGGIVRAFDLLMLELTNAMQLMGQPTLDAIEPSSLRRPTLNEAVEILRTPLPPQKPFRFDQDGNEIASNSVNPNRRPKSYRRPSDGRTVSSGARDSALRRNGESPNNAVLLPQSITRGPLDWQQPHDRNPAQVSLQYQNNNGVTRLPPTVIAGNDRDRLGIPRSLNMNSNNQRGQRSRNANNRNQNQYNGRSVRGDPADPYYGLI